MIYYNEALNGNWVSSYNKLNDSFRGLFVFNVGIDAGFFSEYNNMVLALLYCLKNKVRFALSSKYANFSFDKGLADYFLPFCKEDNRWFNKRYNTRPYLVNRLRYPFFINPIKRVYGIDYFTQDLWDQFHCRNFEQETFDIKELGITGGILQATSTVINHIWQYNAIQREKVDAFINSVGLPDKYLGFHIRKGDKFLEAEERQSAEYFMRAEKETGIRNAFVFTDDYSVIEELREDFPNWKIFTLCKPEEKGYHHKHFIQRSSTQIANSHIKLFANMDILYKSERAYVTYSSNVGMFLAMRCGEATPHQVHAMDFKEWLIW